MLRQFFSEAPLCQYIFVPTSIHTHTKDLLLSSLQFTGTDKSEIARNSVLTSGFEHHWKKKWLGENYTLKNQVDANIQDRTNVSDIRTSFRHSNLMRELHYVAHRANEHKKAPTNLSHGDSSEETKIKSSTKSENKSNVDATADFDPNICFVHLAGHSILMAESLFRGVNSKAVQAGQIAMRDDIEKEVESTKDLVQMWQDKKTALGDAKIVRDNTPAISLDKTGQNDDPGTVSGELQTINLGYGSSATGISGVTPAQVKKFVSRRNRLSQASM